MRGGVKRGRRRRPPESLARRFVKGAFDRHADEPLIGTALALGLAADSLQQPQTDRFVLRPHLEPHDLTPGKIVFRQIDFGDEILRLLVSPKLRDKLFHSSRPPFCALNGPSLGTPSPLTYAAASPAPSARPRGKLRSRVGTIPGRTCPIIREP